jgi:hypothetical protein
MDMQAIAGVIGRRTSHCTGLELALLAPAGERQRYAARDAEMFNDD